MFEQLVDIICNYVEIEQENIKPVQFLHNYK